MDPDHADTHEVIAANSPKKKMGGSMSFGGKLPERIQWPFGVPNLLFAFMASGKNDIVGT